VPPLVPAPGPYNPAPSSISSAPSASLYVRELDPTVTEAMQHKTCPLLYIHPLVLLSIHPLFSLGPTPTSSKPHWQPYPYSSSGSVLATCEINT